MSDNLNIIILSIILSDIIFVFTLKSCVSKQFHPLFPDIYF